MPTFAARLHTCIEERQTSQAELARRAGVKAASVSDWATGKTQPEHIKAEPLLKAAAFLQVNPMWLLTGKGAKHPQSATVLHVAETPPNYAPTWPFHVLDAALVRQLQPNELSRLEGAWLLVAKQLGFSLEKPAAA